ncbi:hypothetical protein ACEQPO_24300 [Bacillus sp. SL00103]
MVIPSFFLPLDETLQVIIEQAVRYFDCANEAIYCPANGCCARNEGFRRWIEGASSSQQDDAHIAKSFGLNVDSNIHV